jgi:hypothetical protein
MSRGRSAFLMSLPRHARLVSGDDLARRTENSGDAVEPAKR